MSKNDASVFLTPPEIQHQTLKAGRGYDRADVDKLLEQVTASYEQVWLERDDLRSRVNELETELAGLHDRERLLGETLVTAQRAAEELRKDAEEEAKRLKLEALADVGEARAEAERELERLRTEIQRARSQQHELRSDLRAFLEGALRQLEGDEGVEEAPLGTLVDALAPEPARVERNDG